MRHAILNGKGKVLGYLTLEGDHTGEILVAKNVDKNFVHPAVDDDIYCVIDKVSVCVNCMACADEECVL